ncbi:hypothetical protein FZC84_05410 [Rossellomorea vietnamensis]|uniref:Uncharacterized protein n=1 Tax=Rossellomorea vietnamensis TaxID=218284 RepID=A0A5D4MHS2_9BACI|nr:hypothetical protein [Rossellomorea vietnamensis]TYS00929.1 hypothetical protein FZC84_05410 [Rossellomorea vietnamensis]
MVTNEKGNTLITVMITSLVVITIGMAILSASIGGAKRTEVRETDIDITYDGLRLVDEMTADLSTRLAHNTFKIENLSASDLSAKLTAYFTAQSTSSQFGDSISCVNVVDVTGSSPKYLIAGTENQCLGSGLVDLETFNIDTSVQLTRVLDFVVSVNTPGDQQGMVNRTVRKRVILSPLPGFLKYAAGAGNQTILNGSPNIAGNVFGKEIIIDKNAHYQLTSGDQEEIETPYSSIFGDIYINSSESDYTAVMDYLTADKFYHQQLPQLKNDSQFVSVNFEKTFTERIKEIQQDQGFAQSQTLDELSLQLEQAIKSEYTFNLSDLPGVLTSPLGEAASGLDSLLGEDIANEVNTLGYKLIDTSISSTIRVPGDLVISSVTSALNFPEKIVADGDIYIIGNKSITLNDIISTGDIHLINLDGEINVKGNILSAGEINIQSNNGFTFRNDNETPGYMLAGKALTIESLDSKSTIIGNLVAGENLLIQGNSNEGDQPEDDEVVFDSVIYSKGEAFISNLNILGNVDENITKQLILLSGGKLTMTRMNEYKNFVPSDEAENYEGKISDETVQPLKAFFYTDQDAELYGVGSLFHIDGGVFANDTLTINAIRGDITSIQDADLYSTNINQDNHYSRFNINYNRDILLQKIDALPKTEFLSLFSDEVSVQ